MRRSTLCLLSTFLAAGPITAEDDSPLRATEMTVCREIVEHTCQGPELPFGPDVEIVAFLTRIEGSTGEAFVQHVWTLQGKEVRRVRLPVRGSPYRTWSSKRVKGMPGKWKAEVLDPVGRSLGSVDFVVKGEKSAPAP